MKMESYNYEYTTGGDPSLLHTQQIGSGGSSIVHEVSVDVF